MTASKMFDKVEKTWNPVIGCLHNCVYCWARRLAECRLKNTERYREGFKPKLIEAELNKRFRSGFIFVSDMGDLFGDWVPKEWIEKVLKVVKETPKATFLFLTKNPARYLEFNFPNNVILGATIETDIDFGLSFAPRPEKRYEAMRQLRGRKMVSIEPILNFSLDSLVEWIREIQPEFVYIGYDNYANRLPEPRLEKTLKLISALCEFTEVRGKTIRKAWNEHSP